MEKMTFHKMVLSISFGLWVSFTLFSPIDCSCYNSKITVESDGLKIKPISQPETYNRFLWVNTSIFNDAGIKPQDCSSRENECCVKWDNKANFTVTKMDDHCEMYIMVTTLNEPLSVTISLEGVSLYGGTELSNQSWPIQNTPFDDAYVSHNISARAVLESYWLDSKGQYVYVDETVPLFVKINESILQLTAKRRDPYLQNEKQTMLKYKLCTFENVKIAHQHAIATVFEKPIQVPNFRMIRYPIWSTWATYKVDVSEEKVLQFADEIARYEFPYSTMEIDDKWETCYGNFIIDNKRFPDMKLLVDKLRDRFFAVTLWIHPFINTECKAIFTRAQNLGYLVKSNNESVITNWWNGEAGTIDFTNPDAAQWWLNRLKDLQNKTGLNSFKFDAGESSWLPQIPVFDKIPDNQPDTIIKAYMETVRVFGDRIELRTARRTQAISFFVRMMDRETRWIGGLSIATLIPTLLQMNIIGYPFVLPDMIGGNEYNGDILTEEMFIRWLQINVFMPALQFSIPPWRFSPQAIKITKKFIALHADYSEKIYELMKKATQDGTPVNLPLWWIAPDDENTYTVDSEFLLGEDILVAPVIAEGAKSRDIYLPSGTWRDENYPRNPPIKGPTMLRNYEAALDILPYFTRVSH